MTSGVRSNSRDDGEATTACHSAGVSRCGVLMATAIVGASNRGVSTLVRVLLDSGSEAHFVTQSTCNRLGLNCRATSEIVSGVTGVECPIRQTTDVVIKSRFSKFQFNLQCLVVSRITRDLPSKKINRLDLDIPSNLHLADSDFSERGSIDSLIGAEFF